MAQIQPPALLRNRGAVDQYPDERRTARMVLWRKFDEFEMDSDFVRWAHQIAHFEVLTFRTKQGKGRLCLDETLIEVPPSA